MVSWGQAGDRSSIRRALVVFAVLAVLRKGPAHAYEMTRQLRDAHELLACESDLYADGQNEQARVGAAPVGIVPNRSAQKTI